MTSLTGRTITWMRSYFICWLSSRCKISFCFLTVGKSNIAELWKGGSLEEQNKILSLELRRCIKAELLQQQDFVKLHLHSVRCISEEKGENQPEQEHSFPAGQSEAVEDASHSLYSHTIWERPHCRTLCCIMCAKMWKTQFTQSFQSEVCWIGC